MPGFTSGKLAKIRVGAGPTTLKGKKWTATMKGQKLDVTNFESGGYGEYIGGILDLDFVIEGDYNYDNPVALLTPGTVMSGTIKLYLNDTGGSYWQITTAYIESFEVAADVRGLITFKVTGCASAAFVVPAA